MKKIIIALFAVALPMMMQAQSEGLISKKTFKGQNSDMSFYAAKGAIPEEGGKVVFKDVISAPGKNKEDMRPSDSYAIAAIMKRLKEWEKSEGRRRIPIYGLQRLYIRKSG